MTRVVRIAGALAVAVCAMLAFLVLTGPRAVAARCGARCPSVSVISGTTRPGAHLTVAGRGFAASHPIRIVMRSSHEQLGLVRTSPAGGFRTSVTLPQTVAGADAVIAVDTKTGKQVRQLLQIGRTAGAVASSGYLGVALVGLAAIGVVLLIGSTLLLRAGRRQRARA